jgi:uncharacterized protein YkwD
MKKAFLNKLVIGIIATTTMTTLIPLGVSASTINTVKNNFYNSYLDAQLKTGWGYNNAILSYFDQTSNVNTDWINQSDKWDSLDKTGTVKAGIIKVDSTKYASNKFSEMITGSSILNNKVYKDTSNEEFTETKIPTYDQIFELNNIVVEEDNQTTVDLGTTTNSENSEDKVSDNNTTSVEDTDTIVSNNTTTTITTGDTDTTVSDTSVDITNVDVQGLPELPKTYLINVQATAEDKILELMNEKRVAAGLKPLISDNTLLQVARYKSNHMIQYNYFDHSTPQGTKYTDWLKAVGYQYTTAGENIAYNTYDAVELFNQWWNSTGHRANMMNASYTKVGIGVIQGDGKYMGTQEFSS